MTKSTLSKSIIFGLIFSIFFGFISNFLYKKLTLQKNKVFYKKLYVVDIVEHEKTSNIGYVETINYTQFVSDHFFSTLNYILSIDKKTNQNAGCKKILVIGGSGSQIGNISSSLEVLETDLLSKFNFKYVGLAGHPEGHPNISNNDLNEIL